MQFGVIYLKTWGGKLVYVAFSTLEFCSSFFFLGGTHDVNSLILHKAISVVSYVKSY